MPRVKVTVKGRDRVNKRLRQTVTAMRRGGRAGARESAERLRALMVEFAPIDTGALVASIRVQEGAKGLVYKVGPGAEIVYAEFVEFGTSNMAAQPYVRPAVEMERSKVGKTIGAAIRAEL